MVTSRTALEGTLQNRLANICKDTITMKANSEELFNLYNNNVKPEDIDATSDGQCYSPTELLTFKRETTTPTNLSEDSGVDVSVPPRKRKRIEDKLCPTSDKRQDAVLSVNCIIGIPDKSHGYPPFRPWSNESASASDVGLRLFHDIQNVDRILSLAQRKEPLEPQPLDLTKNTATERPIIEEPRVTKNSKDICTTSNLSSTDSNTLLTATTTANPTTKHGKNMSKARRIEANARERSRVHTISAAFDTLRATIPSYSKNQKLSKLSTIRIASAYILTLSRLLDMDYSLEQNRPSVDDCVNDITDIIHLEGKTRKRKDET
ncbi:transcription factor Atoh8 [Daktulosphaira vitifoliae]|uniref:transcription factor Atoh8 n=1 Tax=Daktulosphaira vitifoliae TaxID=58002 RepID=UPI0021A97ECA|nr:transcription factor Atoh8 [Daktulosphaira vitifoliae]